jgi:hypothetical protein
MRSLSPSLCVVFFHKKAQFGQFGDLPVDVISQSWAETFCMPGLTSEHNPRIAQEAREWQERFLASSAAQSLMDDAAENMPPLPVVSTPPRTAGPPTVPGAPVKPKPQMVDAGVATEALGLQPANLQLKYEVRALVDRVQNSLVPPGIMQQFITAANELLEHLNQSVSA